GLEGGLEEGQTELGDQEVAIAAHEGEYNALQHSLRSLHSKIETVVYEVQALAAHEQEGQQKRDAFATQATQLEAAEQTAQAKMTDASATLENLRQERDAANNALTEARVALAAEEQLHAALGRQKEPLEQRLRELAQQVEQRRNECSSFLQRQRQLETEVTESRRQID